MRRKAGPDSWPTSTVGIGGGGFAAVDAVNEARLETRRAGPGEAARREVGVGTRGPAPSRWTLRTRRASVEGLTEDPGSGVWRVWQRWGRGLHASCARVVSPDPDYRSKGQRRHRCLRDAARHPDTAVALWLDEVGSQRWPQAAPTGGLAAAGAHRAGNTQQGRTLGALKALTGQGHSLAGSLVGRQPVSQFSSHLNRASPQEDVSSVIQDTWNIPTHPDVLTAWETYPRIKPVWWPPSAFQG